MLSGTYLHDLTNLTILAYLVCQFFSVFFSLFHTCLPDAIIPGNSLAQICFIAGISPTHPVCLSLLSLIVPKDIS